MKKSQFTRVLALLLALLFVLPLNSFAMTAPLSSDLQEMVDLRVNQDLEKMTADYFEMEQEPVVEEDPEIRVIIELSQDSILSYANAHSLEVQQVPASVETNAISQQNQVQSQMTRTGMDFTSLKSFTAVLNGFSAVVNREDLARIEAIAGVVDVSPVNYYERPEVLMTESAPQIFAPSMWAEGFKGEGMVVAVIDSGFDVTHKDFNITDQSKVALTEEDVTAADVSGHYFTAKFPYGWNYYDDSDNIREAGIGSHGQHVAGTVAANGEIKGVAPEAQILGMRVFGADPMISTTTSDVYIKAMDDAVKLGADAINMSLGAAAAFTYETSAEQRAVDHATENGILVAIAAGNDRNQAYGFSVQGNDVTPRSDFPDYGVMSSPGLNDNALTVAASTKYSPYSHYEVQFTVGGTQENRQYVVAEPAKNPQDLMDVELVAIPGVGEASDFTGLDVTDKFAIISRGTIPFTEKMENAKAAGAKGAIIHDNNPGGLIAIQGISDFYAIFVSQETGALLRQADGMVADFVGIMANPDATAYIAEFSTWGVTNDLRLKPEITAPGQGINSTMNENTYASISGTSMATPHIAGAAAVLRQFVDTDARTKDWSLEDKAILIKKLMMNYADQLKNENGVQYSPRQQGAGQVNLKRAVGYTALLTDQASGNTKVELKELADPSFTLNLSLQSFGEQEITYTPSVVLIKDEIRPDGYYTELTTNMTYEVTADDVVLPAGETVNFSIDVDFSDDSIETEQFVDGYVILTGTNGNVISLPFTGFYGDWSRPYILDNFINSEETGGEDPYGPTYFNYSAMMGMQLVEIFPGFEFPQYFFFKNARIDLNPANPVSADTGHNVVIPHLSVMRSLEKMEFNILDENKQHLLTIGTIDYQQKINSLNRGNTKVETFGQGVWEGKAADGSFMPDGKYFYEIKGRLNEDLKREQSKYINILIDTVAPVVDNFRVEGDQLHFTVTDPGAPEYGVGVESIRISTTPESTDNDVVIEVNETGEYTIDHTQFTGATTEEVKLYFFVSDKLLNATVQEYLLRDDITVYPPETGTPTIFIYSPAPNLYGQTAVPLQMDIWGYNNLDKVLVRLDDGEYVEYPFISDVIEVNNPRDGSLIYNGPGYYVDSTIDVPDGQHDIYVKVVAKDGSNHQIRRGFYVDTVAPDLTLTVQDRASDSATAVIDITMFDALGYLKLFQGVEEIYSYDNFPGGPDEEAQTFSVPVDLEMGVNTFTFLLRDAAGRETEKTIEIVRVAASDLVDRIAGSNRYNTAIELSKRTHQTAKTVVLADGLGGIDALGAAPLAIKLDAPILLNSKAGLLDSVKAELERLGTTKVYVVGGIGVLSEQVELDLQAMGIETVRLAGQNRYETSAKIVAEVQALTGIKDRVFLANGLASADALSIGSVAGKLGYGVLLTGPESLPQVTADALAGVRKVVILGGPGAVSEEIEAQLQKRGIETERVAGRTRFHTGVEIAKKYYNNVEHVVLSNGMLAVDALSGAFISYQKNAPVLLVQPDSVPMIVQEYIENNPITHATILGGPGAVSDVVYQHILDLLN